MPIANLVPALGQARRRLRPVAETWLTTMASLSACSVTGLATGGMSAVNGPEKPEMADLPILDESGTIPCALAQPAQPARAKDDPFESSISEIQHPNRLVQPAGSVDN